MESVRRKAAQQATQEQDAALTVMNAWVAQYLKIAKVALRARNNRWRRSASRRARRRRRRSGRHRRRRRQQGQRRKRRSR
jgi:hypothetical protein